MISPCLRTLICTLSLWRSKGSSFRTLSNRRLPNTVWIHSKLHQWYSTTVFFEIHHLRFEVQNFHLIPCLMLLALQSSKRKYYETVATKTLLSPSSQNPIFSHELPLHQSKHKTPLKTPPSNKGLSTTELPACRDRGLWYKCDETFSSRPQMSSSFPPPRRRITQWMK